MCTETSESGRSWHMISYLPIEQGAALTFGTFSPNDEHRICIVLTSVLHFSKGVHQEQILFLLFYAKINANYPFYFVSFKDNQ